MDDDDLIHAAEDTPGDADDQSWRDLTEAEIAAIRAAPVTPSRAGPAAADA